MPLRKEKQYLIDFDEIPGDVADRAKLMVVSYPNNPTTALAPGWWYEKCIAFAKKHHIIVVHDNAYSELVFDREPTGSFLAYPGAKEVGVEFNSLSKTYGLAGARIGFCMGNPDVVEELAKLKSNMDYGISCRCRRLPSPLLPGTSPAWRPPGKPTGAEGLPLRRLHRHWLAHGPLPRHHVCMG